jgi:hypothetical protein
VAKIATRTVDWSFVLKKYSQKYVEDARFGKECVGNIGFSEANY